MTSRYRQGTTLIELAVALSLAALLMTALTGILSSLERQNKRIKFDRLEDTQHAFRTLLWNDLSQARSAALVEGVLVMEVPNSKFAEKPGEQTVSYQVLSHTLLPNRLVRIESTVNAIRPEPSLLQTSLWNVKSIRFERIDEAGNSQPLPNKLGPTPRGLRYSIALDNDQIVSGEVDVR